MTELSKLLKDKEEYWLGPIVKVHRFGDFAFVEFQERDFSSKGNGRLTGQNHFSIFSKGGSTSHSAPSLEQAVICAIAEKYDGCNTQADRLFCKAIGMFDEVKNGN